jgi:hypothetical protein
MKKLLTKAQVLDYLIHHCPLQQSELTAGSYTPDTTPFRVVFEARYHFIHEMISIQSTPWAAYQVLADMVWRDMDVLPYITELYHKALKNR